MTELELQLLALRDDVAWPPTPDLATAVQARRRARAGPRARGAASGCRRGWHPRSPPCWCFFLALGAVLAASPACARPSATGWASARCASPASSACPTSRRLPKLERNRRAVPTPRPTVYLGSPIATVRALGAPDAIYLGDTSPARVSLVYAARATCRPDDRRRARCSTELQGDAMTFVEKFVAGRRADHPGAGVNGARGYFIGGGKRQPPDAPACVWRATRWCGCATP